MEHSATTFGPSREQSRSPSTRSSQFHTFFLPAQRNSHSARIAVSTTGGSRPSCTSVDPRMRTRSGASIGSSSVKRGKEFKFSSSSTRRYRTISRELFLEEDSHVPALRVPQCRPVDSNWTKTRLRGLHPNIHVQRSPSHTSTGTLLWSHVSSPTSSSIYLSEVL